MAIQLINLGTAPKGVDGDTQRTANQKMNANMQHLEQIADTAKTEAAAAKNDATAAQQSAATAQSTANTARSTADTAKSTAESARSTANSANATANSARSTANSAKSTADAALPKAGGTMTGAIAVNGTAWTSGSIAESYTINFVTNWGGKAHFFLRRTYSQYDEAVIRAEVTPSNYRDFTFRSNGNAYANGSWLNASDIRLKENIAPLAGMRAMLAQIQPIHYTMNGQDSLGYSAQELQQVLPDCVHVVGDIPGKDGETITDSLAVNYSALTAFNTQILKEQDAIIQTLLARVVQLEQALANANP